MTLVHLMMVAGAYQTVSRPGFANLCTSHNRHRGRRSNRISIEATTIANVANSGPAIAERQRDGIVCDTGRDVNGWTDLQAANLQIDDVIGLQSELVRSRR